MPDFPVYGKMATLADKMLWVLQWTKDRGITGLANKDIAWLTDHLDDGVPD